MRYGIVSDVHGNLEALRAVLDHLEDVDAVICPGDIVGYGADPDACCDIVREKGWLTVVGNHDAAVAGRLDLSWFNPAARSAALWTREHLSETNLLFLQSLPMIERLPEFILVHANPADPAGFTYINSAWDARPAFREMASTDLCFIGHSHVAECYILEQDVMSPLHISMTHGGMIELKAGSKYIINCGSVGQPRDGNPLASFGIYDAEAHKVEIKRIEYDIDAAQTKILEAGLPEILAQRLSYGK